METYKYRPWKFYITVFLLTWLFWITGAAIGKNSSNNNLSLGLMLLGLFIPPIVAIYMVYSSKNSLLKKDFKKKLIGFHRLKPGNIILAIIIYIIITLVSIGVSILFGGNIEQFSINESFSFSVQGSSALLTILLASTVEELGWRGYGEDAVASYHNWFWESIIFGFIWSAWHIPLFFIEGSYQYGLSELGPLYVINFLIGVVPLGFLTTWVYVKNNRSMLSGIIFHVFVNFIQEKVAMTPETKCIQTIFITLTAVLIVLSNKDMFFERKHIGNILGSSKDLQ